MTRRSVPSSLRWLAIVALLLLTPPIAFFLISAAATADAGLVGWVGIVVLPLALLGSGLYLMTGDRPRWWRSRAENP